MDTIWIDVLQQLITTISGVAFIGLSTIAGIYVKKLTTSLQRKNLKLEIDSFVKAAEQSPSFKDYTGEQKYEVVKARAITWSKDNDVTLSEDELMVLIESSVKDMRLSEPILKAMPVNNEDVEKEIIEGEATILAISPIEKNEQEEKTQEETQENIKPQG